MPRNFLPVSCHKHTNLFVVLFFFGDGGGDGGGGEGDGGGGEGGETGRSKVALGGFVPVFSFCCA